MKLDLEDELLTCMVRDINLEHIRSSHMDRPIQEEIVLRFHWKVRETPCYNVIVTENVNPERIREIYFQASHLPREWIRRAIRYVYQHIDSIVVPQAEQWAFIIPNHMWKNFNSETQTIFFFHQEAEDKPEPFSFTFPGDEIIRRI